MRFFIACALLAGVSLADRDLMTMFKAFKAQHQRSYAGVAEESLRFETFVRNMKRAEVAQAANPLATFGVNAFSDRTDEELKRFHSHASARPTAEARRGLSSFSMSTEEKANARGASIDWRTKGVVGPVVNAGSCNLNWAIAAAANIEGMWAASGKRFVSASAQEFVSCDSTATTCAIDLGSLPYNAFEWALQNTNGSVASASWFPLNNGSTPSCPDNIETFPKAATFKSYVNITESEDDMAAYTYAHGPIAAVAYVTGFSWAAYTGGILTNCNARIFEDFYIAVLVVGYDDTHNPPYWILKNSWGSDWGEAGYIRIQKGVDLCDITQSASSVVIK